MAAICWLCGIFLLLFLLFQLRLRLALTFGEKINCDVCIGPFSLKKRTAKEHRKVKERKKKKEKEKKEKLNFSLSDFFSLLETGLSALKESGKHFCRHLRVDPLSLCIIFAGNDPADVAKSFGIANAAMWSILPKAEELFIIPDPAIHLDMDFEAEKTKVTGEVTLMIRIGSLLMCLLLLALPLLRWYVDWRKKQAVSEKRHQNDQKERTQNDGKESTDQ